MSTAKAWEIAKKAEAEHKNSGNAKKRCELCFSRWRASGSKEEDKPPVYPADFNGRCPDCGSKLSDSFVSF